MLIKFQLPSQFYLLTGMKPCHSCLLVYYQGLQHALKQNEQERKGGRMKGRKKIDG